MLLFSVCTPISNCYHRRCTTGSDQKCVYCEGEVASNAYSRAYTPDIDGGRTCQSMYIIFLFLSGAKKTTTEKTVFSLTFLKSVR